MADKQLIERCKKGDRDAFGQLYSMYSGKMFGICMRYAGDREVAKDLLQDGFVTVFTKIGDFRGDGSFEGWLRRVFVTTALGYLRKNSMAAGMKSTDEVCDLSDDDPSALEKMSADELLGVIGELPEGYRMILNLYAIEGYAHKEIAEMLGINEGTSRSQYARAKAYLRKKLKEEK